MGLNLDQVHGKITNIYHEYDIRSREIEVVGNLSCINCRSVLLSKASIKSGGRENIILPRCQILSQSWLFYIYNFCYV